MDGRKRCKSCKQNLPLDMFYKGRANCRGCHNRARRAPPPPPPSKKKGPFEPVSSDEELDESTKNQKDIDFSKPQVILAVGKPRRGKSHLIKYLILKNTVDNKIFQFGIVFTRTKWDSDYKYIPKQHVFEGYQPEVLKLYLEHLTEMKNPPPNFVVFDDLLGALNNNDGELQNFIISHRHYNTTIFLAAQFLNKGSSTTLRECCTDAFMFNSMQFLTIKALFENFGQGYRSVAKFKKAFFKCTSEPFTAMWFNNDQGAYYCYRAPKVLPAVRLRY